MEWRCEWCGKPHAEDDPPCDNCGHGTFERAVVQHPAEGTALESTTVWVCTECGREHTKHAPPCSRCGNATLDRREQTVDDSELDVPSYLDLVTPRYVLGLAAVVVLGGILLLGMAGVVDLPGMNTGPPAVENVPGSAERYQGTNLSAIEVAYLDRLDEARASADAARFRRDETLDEIARTYNQQFVTSVAGEQERPSPGDVVEWLPRSCEDARLTPVPVTAVADADATPDALGRTLAEDWIDAQDESGLAFGREVGVDVHAVDGQLYLTQVTC